MCTLTRDEAALLARQLQLALEKAAAMGVNPVETIGDRMERSFQVWVRAAGWFWIACRRSAGGAYKPIVFASRDEATRAGDSLAQVVWPSAAMSQEYYFNTQRFM
jgi:hypothetical protein